MSSAALHRLPIGYGVVFPDIDFDETSVEWEQQMVLDAADFRGAADLTEPMQELVDYWTDKTREPASDCPAEASPS